MAIPKKGSRKIVVGTKEYRWNIRRKPSRSQADFGGCVTASTELHSEPGAVLVISFIWNKYCYYVDRDYSHETELPITPKHIEESIIDAIDKGWEPLKKGSQFYYEHQNEQKGLNT